MDLSSKNRVGALGWLASPSMEKEALPNAGVYDRRAALKWIEDLIYLLNGTKSQVSA